MLRVSDTNMLEEEREQLVRDSEYGARDRSNGTTRTRLLTSFVAGLCFGLLPYGILQTKSDSILEVKDTNNKQARHQVIGPPPFCESDHALYRTSMRDIICNSTNTLPEAASSNIIFLHYPKTGGESFEQALHLEKNHNLLQRRQEEYKSPHLAVSIMRNPFTHVLSWYRFCLHGWLGLLPQPHNICMKAHEFVNEHAGPHDTQSVAKAFEQWILFVLKDKGAVDRFFTLTFHDFIAGVMPVYVDYMIRFEHYNEDFEVLMRALGQNVTLEHANGYDDVDGQIKPGNEWNVTYNAEVASLLQQPYREIYTATARNVVEIHYAVDLVAFGYEF